MIEMCDGQLKLYSSVAETTVEWLWYPFIPFGKLTLIQGDPGCGKSTLMMDIISAVSSGGFTPDGKKLKKPMHVIYQCSEDDVRDTIKPRLTVAGADCANVAFLDEETDWITLKDEKIRRAIADFNAKLLVIDPVQAYLGDADIANAASMRKVLHQLSAWASMYDCAVVLIGHLNKKQGSKDLYRGLGSIDLVAAARSVLSIERLEEDDNVAVIHHVKSSLAARNPDVFFTVDIRRKVEWIKDGSLRNEQNKGKQAQAVDIMQYRLNSGPVKATDMISELKAAGLSERTINAAKKALDVRSTKHDGAWHWQLPVSDSE